MISALEAFQQHRSSLFALAYRMLGSKQDAEDILQDAFLKFQSISIDSLESSRAYLITLVSRQCIDALRRARYRQGYEGPWLPEPLVEETVLQACPSELTCRYQQVSQGVLWMMETLSPTQRAVLVLRDVLDLPYERIAEIVEKSADNCRQLYRRAGRKLELSADERLSPREVNQYWIEQLLSALVNADTQALLKLLHEDASLVSDGGGKVAALSKPLRGRESILTFLAGLQHFYRDDEVHLRTAHINNEPGILIYVNGLLVTTCTIIRQGEQIRYLLMVRNPDKLGAARREMS